MQRAEAQEFNTTEEKVEVYNNRIEESIANYCIDHNLKEKDLYTIDQSRWNSVLLYVYKHVFKPNKKADNKVYRYNEKSNIDYSNKDLLDEICDIYINLCYEYSKEVSIMGFSKLTGIHKDTIYQWLNSDSSARGASDLAKRLNAEREESLSNKLASGKGNPVGILGILNRHYGWNMGQPRGQESRQKAPDVPQIAEKYGVQLADNGKIQAIPEKDF